MFACIHVCLVLLKYVLHLNILYSITIFLFTIRLCTKFFGDVFANLSNVFQTQFIQNSSNITVNVFVGEVGFSITRVMSSTAVVVILTIVPTKNLMKVSQHLNVQSNQFESAPPLLYTTLGLWRPRIYHGMWDKIECGGRCKKYIKCFILDGTRVPEQGYIL